jgi:hypothetical protein
MHKLLNSRLKQTKIEISRLDRDFSINIGKKT